MKASIVYLLAPMLILCARGVNAQEFQKRQDSPGRSTERNSDPTLKRLRTVLKGPGSDKISYILGKSKEITIMRGESGQIRVSVGRVSREILTTKIKRVAFTPNERYNAEDAVTPILLAKEVQATMHKLGVELPMTASPGIRQLPDPHLPHLPASMENVSTEEAFDRIAQTFDGIVIYGEWTNEGARMFSASFVWMSYLETLMRKGP